MIVNAHTLKRIATCPWHACMECFKDIQKYEIMLTRPQTEVLARRRKLFQLLDGDLFYKMRDWEKDFVKIFWSKPICDEDTFKLTLFLYNNGCPHMLLWNGLLHQRFGQEIRHVKDLNR